MNEPLLTIREVAATYGVCTETIRRYVRRGLLVRHEFTGRMHRYRKSDVERLAETCRTFRQPHSTVNIMERAKTFKAMLLTRN